MASAYQIQPALYFAQFSDYPPSFMTKERKFLTKSGYWEIVPLISPGTSFLPALFINLILSLPNLKLFSLLENQYISERYHRFFIWNSGDFGLNGSKNYLNSKVASALKAHRNGCIDLAIFADEQFYFCPDMNSR